MGADLSFLPDQQKAEGKRRPTEIFMSVGGGDSSDKPDLSFLPDKESSGPDLSFLPDKSADLSFLPDKSAPTVPGLFGTSFLENNKYLGYARMPAAKSREGLKLITDAIPEPETTSVAGNMALNIPKTAAEVFADFSSSVLEPESALLAGYGKVAATPAGRAALGKVGQFAAKNFPTFKKALEYPLENMPAVQKGVDMARRFFTYSGLKPKAYLDLVDQAALKEGGMRDQAMAIGDQLANVPEIAGKSQRAAQLRAGQILKGGVSVSDSEAPLRDAVGQARTILDDLQGQAKDEGLLGADNYFAKLSKAKVNDLNLQKQKLEDQINGILGLPQKEKIKTLVGALNVGGRKTVESRLENLRNAIVNSPDITTEDMRDLGREVIDRFEFMRTKMARILNIDTGQQERLKDLVTSLRHANDKQKATVLNQILDLSDEFRDGGELLRRNLGKRVDAVAVAVDNLDVGGKNQLAKFADQFQQRFKGRADLLNDVKNSIAEIDDRLWINKMHGGTPYTPRMYREFEVSDPTDIPFEKIFGSNPNRIVGKRFLERGDVPYEVRKALGEINEPAYPVAKAIIEVTHDVEKAKLFRQVAENPEWASSVEKKGFVQLEGSPKRLGALADKWVHPEIARDLNEMNQVPSEAMKLYSKLNTMFKFGKTIANPATHFRNMMGNSILLHFSGLDPVEQVKFLTKAGSEMLNEGAIYKEAKAAGLMGNEFIANEMKDLLDNFNKPAQTLYERFANGLKQAAGKAADLYQGEEKWFKLAKFIAEREKGVGVKEAAETADRWLINYGKVSPFVKAVRKSPMGAPFVTYSSKALPLIAEGVAKRPLVLWQYKSLFDSFENIAKQKLGISKEDVDTIKKNSRGSVLILPWKDKNNQLQTLDLSYILPWGDVGEQGGLGGLPPAFTPGGAFLRPAAEALLMNKSLYKGSQPNAKFDPKKAQIYLESDTPGQKATKKADYLYKAVMPAFAPPVPGVSKGGYALEKLSAAIQNKPDYFGRTRSLPTALADIFLGLKASPVDPKMMRRSERLMVKKEADEVKADAVSRLRNHALTPEERTAIIKEIEQKRNALRAKTR